MSVNEHPRRREEQKKRYSGRAFYSVPESELLRCSASKFGTALTTSYMKKIDAGQMGLVCRVILTL